MAENVQRSRGRPQGYKFDRGGVPAEMGPYIGIVVNNVDAIRSGRLQVYIEEFGATNANGTPNLTDPTLWRTVSYCPPFYGATPVSGTSAGVGTFPGNRNSYGMWFTPPDIGVRVICFFVGGDPSQGYYLGCVPEPGITHMIPAIGASRKYVPGNTSQRDLLQGVPAAPVTEINELNTAINENPQFYDQPRPVQSVVAGTLFQQGLDKDPIRGPIKSSSQRESPSSVYGISTPGKPIYSGGLDPKTIREKLERNEITPQQINVIGRQGGHTFVMDDGDIDGKDTLVRIRTAKGHQITMSDDGDTFFIIHANGQTWLEFGKQGTVDIYSTNSINLRTEGTLNLHADRDINMYAGGNIKMKAANRVALDSQATLTMTAQGKMILSAQEYLGLRSDGNMALKGKKSSWDGGSSLNFRAGVINLNGAPALPVPSVPAITNFKLADTEYVAGQGWIVKPGTLDTIVTRAPTHEPYPYHNKGVNVKTNLNSATVEQDPVTINPATGQALVSANASAGARKSINFLEQVNKTSITKPLTVERYVSEIPASSGIGQLNQGLLL